jgi:hypothetical protein
LVNTSVNPIAAAIERSLVNNQESTMVSIEPVTRQEMALARLRIGRSELSGTGRFGFTSFEGSNTLITPDPADQASSATGS